MGIGVLSVVSINRGKLEMCKFSILTACYNDEAYLDDCINSMMNQTVTDFEWIIVDDCSTDGSKEKLSAITDKRVKVMFNDERLYCSSTYARALTKATGDVCAVLDADDALHRKAIGKVSEMYRRHPGLRYIYTQHYWCDQSLNKIRVGLSGVPRGGRSFATEAVKHKRHCFSHWRTFRRSMVGVDTIFPPGLKYAVDKNMGFVLEEHGQGGFFPKALYLYRYYKGNMSRVYPSEQKKTWLGLASQFAANGRHKHKVTTLK